MESKNKNNSQQIVQNFRNSKGASDFNVSKISKQFTEQVMLSTGYGLARAIFKPTSNGENSKFRTQRFNSEFSIFFLKKCAKICSITSILSSASLTFEW